MFRHVLCRIEELPELTSRRFDVSDVEIVVARSGERVFALVYAGFASASETWHFGVLFLLYGIYAAATEGVVKAWISNLSKAKDRGRAIGAYEGLRSVATLLASAGAGLVWQQFGPETLFFLTAGIVLTIAIYLSSIRLPGFVADEE